MSKLENLIYKMLTTNTGIALCDSGGANGRMWQINQKKTIDDFRNENHASLEFNIYAHGDKQEVYINPYVSVFHYLTSVLSLDDDCNRFNRQKVTDWEGEFYGTSKRGAEWINARFYQDGESWNTYNWECPLSQTLQGVNLTHTDTDERYVLLQIHNGADVRGGYTNAKLFKCNSEQFLLIDLYTDKYLYQDNSLILREDYQTLSNSDLLNIADELGVTNEKSVSIPANFNEG